MAMNLPDFSGETLDGRYRLVERIGHGGMATVYEAVDTQLDKPVAVKILHPHFAIADDYLARFRQEAFAAAKIRHPNLVDVTDLGIDEGRAYLVMELLQGESLSARIEREAGPIPWPEAVAIATQICDALAHTHSHRLIHRDIKPANIFLAAQPGRPGVYSAKLLDLGIAKVLRDESSLRQIAPETRLTQGTPGTPEYMSPEQALGVPIDHRIDIYAIGVTLYRMLTGFLPFQSQTSVYEVQRMHVELPPPPLFVLAPEAQIPPSIQEVVLRALAKRPNERHATAQELGEALFLAQEAEFGRAPPLHARREEQATRRFRRERDRGPSVVQRLLVTSMVFGTFMTAATVFMLMSLFDLPFVGTFAGGVGAAPPPRPDTRGDEIEEMKFTELPDEPLLGDTTPPAGGSKTPEPEREEPQAGPPRPIEAPPVSDGPPDEPVEVTPEVVEVGTSEPSEASGSEGDERPTKTKEPEPEGPGTGPKGSSTEPEGPSAKPKGSSTTPKEPSVEPKPKPKDPKAQAEAAVRAKLGAIARTCKQARPQQVRLMITVDYSTGKIEARESGLDTRGGKCVCEALKHVRIKPVGQGTGTFPLGTAV